ncbi:MAG: cytochrome b/b6 domain-containing protein, partial [Myxococcota bacterium]
MSGRPSRVWDLPTRAFHWGLAGAFGLAMVSGEEPSLGSAHVAAGWAAAALVAFRVGWGWAGVQFGYMLVLAYGAAWLVVVIGHA